MPRAVDGFEIAVRAVVGQQISVAAARTVLRRLGAPARLFPTAEELLGLPDAAFAMPVARRAHVAGAGHGGRLRRADLDGGGDRAETVRRLTELPGIGAWTAQYMAMRALGDPDVLLPTDLGGTARRRRPRPARRPHDPRRARRALAALAFVRRRSDSGELHDDIDTTT